MTQPAEAVPELPLGFNENVDPRLYHVRRLAVVSKGALDKVARSPLHYRAWVEGLDEDTDAFAFGRAFHCSVLEPKRFDADYTVEPSFGDCRFKENKARRDAWRADNAGKELLSAENNEAILGMARSVRAHPLAGKMVSDGIPEVTITWRDEETKLLCKVRPDYYVRRLKMVADIKSTLDASWESFRRDVAKYKYHWQDALYRDGMNAVSERVDHFVFVAVEKKPPYAIAIYALDQEAVGRGYTGVRNAILTLSDCVRSNKYPGYPETIQSLELPSWA